MAVLGCFAPQHDVLLDLDAELDEGDGDGEEGKHNRAGRGAERPDGEATSPPLSSKGKAMPESPGTPPPMGLTSAALNIIFEADKELVFHRPLDELLEKIMDLAGRAVRFERGL